MFKNKLINFFEFYIISKKKLFAADFITPKFYSKEVETKKNYDVGDRVKAMIKKDNEKPRDLYRWPLLSSQR